MTNYIITVVKVTEEKVMAKDWLKLYESDALPKDKSQYAYVESERTVENKETVFQLTTDITPDFKKIMSSVEEKV